MGQFNLKDYDTVETRLKEFYKKYDDGRVVTDVIFQDGNRTVIKASIYLDKEDQLAGLVKATGVAEEERMAIQTSNAGKEYEPVNYSSWTENCETSAIGRALANMDMSGNKRPSREEMEKVERYSKSKQTTKEQVYGTENTQFCSVCGKGISSKVAEYSMEKYGKYLCFEHQQNDNH